MRTWTFDDCIVEEIEHDYDLTALLVTKTNGNTQTIYPGDIEDLQACIAKLDEGESPIDCWEDGNGNMIDEDSGEYSVNIIATDRDVTEMRLYDSMETAVEDISSEIQASRSIVRAEISSGEETKTVWDAHYLMVEVGGWRIVDTDITAYDRSAKTATVVREYLDNGLCVTIAYATTAKVADILRKDPENEEVESELMTAISVETDDSDIVVVPLAKSKVEAVKTITQSGTSLMVAITSEVRAMGLGRGDKVKITLERV